MKSIHMLAAVLFLSFWQGASAQDIAGPTIRLRVFHNGRVISGPDHIEIEFCGSKVKLPIRDHEFSIPIGALECSEVALRIKAGSALLRPTIPVTRLREGLWDVFFAESKFGHGYDSYIKDLPAKRSIRSFCVVSFEPNGEEGTFLLDPHCRVPHP